jgi:hypothetical protein
VNNEPYPLGATMTFVDANATVSDGVAGLRTGVINGPPITDYDDSTLYVPVFAKRDNGREPTTIWVHVANVMGVDS